MNPTDYPLEISVADAKRRLDDAPKETLLIDVRELYETAICALDGARHIPMRQIPEQLDALPRDRHLLVFCHHGGRSLRVTEFLRSRGMNAVSNIAGGIDAWAVEIDPSIRRY